MFVLSSPDEFGSSRMVRLLPAPFLDITDRVDSQGNEQGLLGSLSIPTTRRTGSSSSTTPTDESHNVIARFHVSADPDQADAAIRIDPDQRG